MAPANKEILHNQTATWLSCIHRTTLKWTCWSCCSPSTLHLGANGQYNGGYSVDGWYPDQDSFFHWLYTVYSPTHFLLSLPTWLFKLDTENRNLLLSPTDSSCEVRTFPHVCHEVFSESCQWPVHAGHASGGGAQTPGCFCWFKFTRKEKWFVWCKYKETKKPSHFLVHHMQLPPPTIWWHESLPLHLNTTDTDVWNKTGKMIKAHLLVVHCVRSFDQFHLTWQSRTAESVGGCWHDWICLCHMLRLLCFITSGDRITKTPVQRTQAGTSRT